MNLQEKIKQNRKRELRFDLAERRLRWLRQRIFDFEDMGPAKYEQARRCMQRCKERAAPRWEARQRNNQARKLEQTPSAFEPGACG